MTTNVGIDMITNVRINMTTQIACIQEDPRLYLARPEKPACLRQLTKDQVRWKTIILTTQIDLMNKKLAWDSEWT